MRKYLKPIVFVICLLPLAWLAWLGFNNMLGANPIEAGIRYLGDWSLRILLVCLAVTPLRLAFRQNWPMRLRRMLGLFAFAYAVLHILGYVGVDQFFAWSFIWADIVKRNFITVGMAVFLLLLPLAMTSTNAMVRKLGGKRWRLLHQAVYPAAILAVLHYYMMIKAGWREPAIYAAVLLILLALRKILKPRPGATTSAPAPNAISL